MIDYERIRKAVASLRATAHAYRRDGNATEFHRLMQAAQFYLRFARPAFRNEETDHDRAA